jgi:hypothetical protein
MPASSGRRQVRSAGRDGQADRDDLDDRGLQRPDAPESRHQQHERRCRPEVRGRDDRLDVQVRADPGHDPGLHVHEPGACRGWPGPVSQAITMESVVVDGRPGRDSLHEHGHDAELEDRCESSEHDQHDDREHDRRDFRRTTRPDHGRLQRVLAWIGHARIIDEEAKCGFKRASMRATRRTSSSMPPRPEPSHEGWPDARRREGRAARREAQRRAPASQWCTGRPDALCAVDATDGLSGVTDARQSNRAVGLLEFGGVVRTEIKPRKAQALYFGGRFAANVKTPRHYRGQHFLSRAVSSNTNRIADAIADEVVKAFNGFEVHR